MKREKLSGKCWALVLAIVLLFAAVPPACAFDAEHDSGHNMTGYGGSQSSTPNSNRGQSGGGDPVILSSGDLAFHYTDLLTPGRMPLELTRQYHTQERYNGPMGYGWNMNYNIQLVETTDEVADYVILRTGNGIRIKFVDNGDGTYTPPPGRFQKLTYSGGLYTLTLETGVKYEFNSLGALTSITDQYSNQITLAYDGQDRLSTVTNDAGKTLTFTYAANGKVQSVTDSASRTVTYSYDTAGNLAEVADPMGNTISYGYDLEHRLISITNAKHYAYLSNTYDSLGRVTTQIFNDGVFTFEYDTENNITTLTDRKGVSTEYHMNGTGNVTSIVRDSAGLALTTMREFDANMNLISETDPAGNTSTYTYDDSGNVLTATTALGNTTSFTYDAVFSNMESSTNALGKTVSFTYDANGKLLTKTDTLGDETTYTYDTNGDLLTITRPSGGVTTYVYDSDGNPTSITDALGKTVSVTYDDIGNPLTITDQRGNVTELAYNALNQVISHTDPLGNVTQYEYDELGNQTKIIDPLGNATTMQYNNYNQLVSVTDPLGNTFAYTYDANDKVVSITDPEGNSTTYTYDALNRLTQMTDALDNSTQYAYELNGLLDTMTDRDGHITSFDYDARGRLTLVTYPDTSTESFVYDPVGNIISRTDRNSNTTTYAYDDMNRLTGKSFPDASGVTYSYDALARTRTIAGLTNSITYTYDLENHITQVDEDGAIVGYEYDNAGNRTKLTYPDGTFITYAYDALNRLQQVRDQAGLAIATYAYDAKGRRYRKYLKNGTYTQYQFDNGSRLTSMSNKKSSDQSVYSSFGYTYDGVRNRLSMTTEAGSHNYTYDANYQLTDVTYPDASSGTYNYDAAGNLTSVVKGATTNYVPNNLNQYSSVGGVSYTYDNNGNLLSDGVNTYTYDYENHLTEVVTPSDTVTFKYNPVGKRIAKTDVSGTVNYIYDFSNIIAEANNSGTVLAAYIYGAGMDEALLMNRSGVDYYFQHDALGSVVGVTDSSGNLVESYTYDVYGEPSVFDSGGSPIGGSAVGNPLMHTGSLYDPGTGLYYMRGRYYGPTGGRFISADPVGLGGGENLYAYVFNNPVNYVDPFGLSGFKSAVDAVKGYVGLTSSSLNSARTGNTSDHVKTTLAAAGIVQSGLETVATQRASVAKTLLDSARRTNSSGLSGRFATHLHAERNLRLAKAGGTALNVAGVVMDTYSEYTDCKNSNTTALGRGANALGVGGTSALVTVVSASNPGVAIGTAASGLVDAGFEAYGYQRPGAFELVNNASRYTVAITESVAQGNTRSVDRLISRMRRGDMGSISQSFTRWSETAGEYWYDTLVGD